MSVGKVNFRDTNSAIVKITSVTSLEELIILLGENNKYSILSRNILQLARSRQTKKSDLLHFYSLHLTNKTDNFRIIETIKRLGISEWESHHRQSYDFSESVSSCTTFTELLSLIQQAGSITGSDGLEIDKNRLIILLSQISSGDPQIVSRNLIQITRSNGIRSKVQELLNNLLPDTEISKEFSSLQVLEEIRKNLAFQPKNVQEFIEYASSSWDSLFQENTISIDNNIFLFPKIQSGRLKISLQKSIGGVLSSQPSIWSLRFYRKSGSDLQPKAVFGYLGRFIKGNETDNIYHHYATSGKIPESVLIHLGTFDDTDTYNFQRFLPQTTEFRESNFEPRNQDLRQAIDYFRDLYKFMFGCLRSDGDGVGYFAKHTLDSISNPDIKNFMELMGVGRKIDYEEVSVIRDFITSKLSTFRFKFTPNFDNDLPIKSYLSGETLIEEFRVTTPEGDSIIFCMAKTNNGILYVDRIYAEPDIVTPYGTHQNIINFGLLTYKPYDYLIQIPFLRNFYDRDNGRYNSLKPHHDSIPIVEEYRRSLVRRGLILN